MYVLNLILTLFNQMFQMYNLVFSINYWILIQMLILIKYKYIYILISSLSDDIYDKSLWLISYKFSVSISVAV